MKRTILTMIAISAIAAGANAATLLAWDTTGLTGVTAGSLNSTTTDPTMVTGILSRGSGLTASTLSNGYASQAWSNSLSAAISGNDFYQITVASASGFTMSLSSLSLDFRNTSTGVREMQWEYSLDNFATAGVAVGSLFTLPGATTVANYGPVDLSGVTALQNIASVTFRLYGYNDTGNLGATGTGAIGTNPGDDIGLVGTTTSVPEPSTTAMLFGGAGAMFWMIRRKRAIKG